MYLHAMLSRRLAAGHSGQYNTARRSEMRLSNIVRYSASLEFLVAFVLPDLVKLPLEQAKGSSSEFHTVVSGKG